MFRRFTDCCKRHSNIQSSLVALNNLAVVINILLYTISQVFSLNWQYKTLTLIYLNNLPFIFDFLRTFLCLKSQNMHPIAGARQTSAIFV